MLSPRIHSRVRVPVRRLGTVGAAWVGRAASNGVRCNRLRRSVQQIPCGVNVLYSETLDLWSGSQCRRQFAGRDRAAGVSLCCGNRRRTFSIFTPAPTRRELVFMMRTFSIHTLGCRVNHYESEQIAAVLRGAGLVQVEPAGADLRVVHTCSVTTEAASKSRQAARRATRLPVLQASGEGIPIAQAIAVETA